MEKHRSISPKALRSKRRGSLVSSVDSNFDNAYGDVIPPLIKTKTRETMFENRVQNAPVNHLGGLRRNKASYYRKDSNASSGTKSTHSKRRKSSIGSHLDVKSNLNKKYKKLKSPSEVQTDAKRL